MLPDRRWTHCTLNFLDVAVSAGWRTRQQMQHKRPNTGKTKRKREMKLFVYTKQSKRFSNIHPSHRWATPVDPNHVLELVEGGRESPGAWMEVALQ